MVEQDRLDRLPRHRDRGRGAARRAAVHQAPPAAVQHPPARRQVLPVHRDQPRRGVPARLLHPRAPPLGADLLRPLLLGEAGPRDARPARPAVPVPHLRGPGARAALGRARASTTTSSAARRPASATSTARSTGAGSTRSSTSSPAATATSSATSSARWARPRATEEFERAAVYRDRLEAVRSLMERRSVAGESLDNADLVAVAVEGTEANAQVFQVRDGLLAERHGFYLANEAEADEAEVTEEFLAQYYSAAPVVPRLVVVGPQLRDRAGLLAEALSARRGGPVEVRVSERGSKRRLRELAERNAVARPRPGQAAPGAPPRAARRRALGAPGRARARVAAGADRGLRHLQHRRRAHGRLDGRLPRAAPR